MLLEVKRAATAAAIARGDDVEAVGVDAAVYERVVAKIRELLAACQQEHPGTVAGFYIGSAKMHRVELEAFAWANRRGEPLVETVAGVRVTAPQLRAAGFVRQTLYQSSCAYNVDDVEKTV